MGSVAQTKLKGCERKRLPETNSEQTILTSHRTGRSDGSGNARAATGRNCDRKRRESSLFTAALSSSVLQMFC